MLGDKYKISHAHLESAAASNTANMRFFVLLGPFSKNSLMNMTVFVFAGEHQV